MRLFQVSQYGPQTVINLIDQKGSEKLLEEEYGRTVARVSSSSNKLSQNAIKYIAFDFHHECRKMKYENLSKLVKQVEADFEAFGFTRMQNNSAVPASAQKGVFRVNCVDNLDRTNVVQGLLSSVSLRAQFKALNLDVSLDGGPFEALRKQAWADNGDYLSTVYSGTGAIPRARELVLSGDFW